jgi:hypothetical protein
MEKSSQKEERPCLVRLRCVHAVRRYRRRQTLDRYRDRERLALTTDQLRDHNLTPIIKSDRRFKNRGAHHAVETEALSQRTAPQPHNNLSDLPSRVRCPTIRRIV